MLPEKAPAEELDKNKQRRLHKIVVKFLYYARSIDPTMLMELNSLAAVQTKPAIKTAKNTHSLKYSAIHTDAVHNTEETE